MHLRTLTHAHVHLRCHTYPLIFCYTCYNNINNTCVIIYFMTKQYLYINVNIKQQVIKCTLHKLFIR